MKEIGNALSRAKHALSGTEGGAKHALSEVERAHQRSEK